MTVDMRRAAPSPLHAASAPLAALALVAALAGCSDDAPTAAADALGVAPGDERAACAYVGPLGQGLPAGDEAQRVVRDLRNLRTGVPTLKGPVGGAIGDALTAAADAVQAADASALARAVSDLDEACRDR